MDKFIEYVMDRYKWENILLLILALILPGLVFIFVWNREVFLDMDVIKLLLFSFAMDFMIFIPNLIYATICTELESKYRTDGTDDRDLIPFAVIITVLTIACAVIYKLFNPTFSIPDFIVYDAIFLFGVGLLKVVVEYVRYKMMAKNFRMR